MNSYAVTYGQIAGRGGWQIQAQDIIEARCLDDAITKAYRIARKYRDSVLDVRPIMYDKDLLDYESIEVI